MTKAKIFIVVVAMSAMGAGYAFGGDASYELRSLQGKVSALESKNKALEHDVADLKKEAADLRRKIIEIEDKAKHTNSDQQEKQKTLDERQDNKLERLRRFIGMSDYDWNRPY